MAEKAIKLFSGTLQNDTNNLTPIYTGQANKTCVIKSIMLCNTTSAAISVMFDIGFGSLMRYKKISPNQSLVIPVTDVIVSPGEEVYLYSATPGCNARISAVEIDGTPASLGLQPYRETLAATTFRRIVPANTNGVTRLTKSFVICNTFSTDAKVTIRFGSSTDNDNLIKDYTVAAFDTILIPFADVVLMGGEYIEGSSTATGIRCMVTMKEVD